MVSPLDLGLDACHVGIGLAKLVLPTSLKLTPRFCCFFPFLFFFFLSTFAFVICCFLINYNEISSSSSSSTIRGNVFGHVRPNMISKFHIQNDSPVGSTNMISSTNCILTGLAVSDGLTMAAYLPFALRFYVLYGLDWNSTGPIRRNSWTNANTELNLVRFYVPLDTKKVISETFLPANILARY